MPLYDYKCKACEKVFELSHSMNELPTVFCPFCGKQECFKLMSGCNYNFKTDLSPELAQAASDQRASIAPAKERFEKTLAGLDPKEHVTGPPAGGCVQSTRIELEERYGTIFERSGAKSGSGSSSGQSHDHCDHSSHSSKE